MTRLGRYKQTSMRLCRIADGVKNLRGCFKIGVPLLVLFTGIYLITPYPRLLRTKEDVGVFFVTPRKLGMYFRQVGSACGKGGHVYAFYSSDGVYLSETVIPYSSSKVANAALQKCIAEAMTITEQTAKFNKQEQMVGERIVGFFRSKEADEQVSAVIWTQDDALCLIESASMSHVLEFERSYYR